MAQVKLTVVRGKPAMKDIAISPGTPIAGSDALELNVDVTRATKNDVLMMIDGLRDKIYSSPWPMA